MSFAFIQPKLGHICYANGDPAAVSVVQVPAQLPVLTTTGPFSLQNCNGAYLIQNISSQITGFVSSSKQEFGLSHPLGQVFKTQKSVTYSFFLDSGKTCYVKSYANCIKFSSSTVPGPAYLIDQTGVRHCYEEFKELNPGVAQSMWNRNYESEINRHQRAIEKKKLIDPSSVTIADIAVPEGESVVINHEDMQLFSETRELSNMTISLTDNFFVSVVLNKGSQDGILVRCSRYRFRQSIFFDGKNLVVMFDTQSASLGKYGEFSLSK